MATLSEVGCKRPKLSRPWMPLGAFATSGVLVAIYVFFQSLYAVFVLMYLSTVVLIVAWTATLAFRPRVPPPVFSETERGSYAAREAFRVELILPLWKWAMWSYVFCGGAAWVTDFVLCAPISRIARVWAPMFLHPVWHLGAGTGTWLAIQVVAAARAEALGLSTQASLRWLGPAFPYVAYESEGAQAAARTGIGIAPKKNS